MKQALTKALADVEKWIQPEVDYHIIAAAHLVERLLPGVCPTCGGVPNKIDRQTHLLTRCSDCHGSGQVWDEGIVEAVAAGIREWDVAYLPATDGQGVTVKALYDGRAVAGLSALVELLTEKVKT